MPDINFFHVEPPILETSRWIPLVNKSDYLSGYFEYIEKAKAVGLPYTDTNLKRARLFALAGWCEAICARGGVHHVVECGCYLGHSTYALATILRKSSFTKTFHVFDSFEGLSDFSEEDLSAITSNVTADILRRAAPQFNSSGKRPFAGSLDIFQGMLGDFGFVRPYKGWIPSRFHEVSDLTFSLVTLDLDIFKPTQESLEFFYPRVISGGLIWLDDYGLSSWPGCVKAVDQFVREYCQDDLVMKNPFGGLVILKR
jgi:O-methyltransferase